MTAPAAYLFVPQQHDGALQVAHHDEVAAGRQIQRDDVPAVRAVGHQLAPAVVAATPAQQHDARIDSCKQLALELKDLRRMRDQGAR
jgi:hypothetical protein